MSSSPYLRSRSSGGATPLVRFSILYQLRHHATSVTARNASVSPRASSHFTPPRPTQQHRPGSSSPARSGVLAFSPEAPVAGGQASGAIEHVPAPLLLSTMDKRELSKVVVRDAVFARVLDLVPSRQYVQTAVWTLSPQVIQIDGAVTVCVMPRDASILANSRGYSPYAAALHGGSTVPDVRSTCALVRERVEELTADSRLLACLLQPYLGEVGSQGDIVHAHVAVEVVR